jgi:hypothetical protein
VDGNEITEYVARDVDGGVEVRSTQDDNPQYPAVRWAHDQQALGASVKWRRIRIVDDWADLPPETRG